MNSDKNELISKIEPLSNPLENKTIEKKQGHNKSAEKKLPAQESRKIFIGPLLAFAIEVKGSTSFFMAANFQVNFALSAKKKSY